MSLDGLKNWIYITHFHGAVENITEVFGRNREMPKKLNL